MRKHIRRLLNWRTAFGELLIVVIGVLIALTVDSWWTERSERREEAEHIAALKVEAEQNLAALYASFETLRGFAKSNRALLEIIEGARDLPSDDELVELTWLAFSYAQFNPQFTAYENLLSTGSVRLITDKSLKLELARFRSSAAGLAELDWQMDQWNSIIQPWIVENLHLDWLPPAYRERHQLPEPRTSSDWNSIIEDPTFKGILVNRVVAFADFELGLKRIRPSAEALALRLGVDIDSLKQPTN